MYFQFTNLTEHGIMQSEIHSGSKRTPPENKTPKVLVKALFISCKKEVKDMEKKEVICRSKRVFKFLGLRFSDS